MLKKWFPTWAIPVVIVFSIVTVWLRLNIVRTTYSINEVNHQIDQAREKQELLQLKVAALRSPRRLEALAKARFGLALPGVHQTIRLSGDSLNNTAQEGR